MTDYSKIRNYYKNFPEDERLSTPAGKLEFELTEEQLKKYLKAGMKVLDLGGGTGSYTIRLIEEGIEVFLADLSPELIEIARTKINLHPARKRLIGSEVLSALDLKIFSKNSFDAVLCLGPFYHLCTTEEQIQAAKEINRVLKAQGHLFAAFIPRLSGVAQLIKRAMQSPDQVTAKIFQEAFDNGIFKNPTSEGFQEGYFFAPEEIEKLFATTGFEKLETVAVQGLAVGLENELFKVRKNKPELFEIMMNVIRKSSLYPSVLDLGGHCLYTGQKSN